MQGKKIITPQLFYHQSLDEMVPKDNFYRKINENLSLGGKNGQIEHLDSE